MAFVSAALRAAAAVACALGVAPAASAAFVVVPPANADTQGGFGGVTPFAFSTTQGVRSQIAYDASLFAGVSGPQLITAIQFRPIDPAGGFFGTTLTVSDVRLQLSTTARSDENRTPLSTRFADNVGADAVTVFRGPLTLTTASTLLPNGTRAFDYVITLQTPFIYDPAAGNLLLDTLVPVGATLRGNSPFGAYPRFDTVNRFNDGVSSVLNNSNGGAATGVADTSGPVTRFALTPVAPGAVTATPAPPGVLLAVAGAGTWAVAGAARRLRRAG